MNKLILDARYDFSRFIPSRGERSFVSRGRMTEADEALAFVAVASADRYPLEVIKLRPGEIASIPASVKGKKTRVRYTGEAPMTCVERDEFDNLQVSMLANSAIEVVYVVEGKRGRKEYRKKIYKTV